MMRRGWLSVTMAGLLWLLPAFAEPGEAPPPDSDSAPAAAPAPPEKPNEAVPEPPVVPEAPATPPAVQAPVMPPTPTIVAPESGVESEETVSRPLSFQFAAVYLFQSAGGSTLTGQFAWTPVLGLGPVALRFELGLSIPRNALGDRFIAMQYEVFLRAPVGGAFSVEAGGGYQTFTAGNGGTHPILGVNGVFGIYSLLIERVQIGLSRFFDSNPTNGVSVALGFDLEF